MVSATEIPPDNCRVASVATDVVPAVVPSAVLLLIARTPFDTVVLPVYELPADNVSTLVSEVFFVRAPLPEIAPDRV